MATAPPLYINLSTGGSQRFATADILQVNNLAGFAVSDNVTLFDNLTTGNITLGGAQTASGTITLGTAANLVTIPGDLTVDGTELVQTDSTVNGDFQVDGASTLGDGTLTDILDVNGPVDVDVPSTGTFAVNTSGAAGTIVFTATGAGATDAISLVTATTGDIAINSVAGLDMDAGAVADLRGATGMNLSTAAGELDITSAAALDLNGTVATLDGSTSVAVTSQGALGFTATSGTTSFTCTGQSVTVDGAGISIDGTAASNFSTSAGAITIDAAASTLTLDGNSGVSIVGNAAEVDITTSAAVDINSGAFTVDGSTVSIDGTDTTNLTMTATDAGDKVLTIASSNGGAGADDIQFTARGGGATLNESGQESLNGGLTATSLIGAINENYASIVGSGNNLEQSYLAFGAGAAQVDLNGASEGDLSWRLDTTGAAEADFLIQHGATASSYYLATDAANTNLVLGSTAGATDISVQVVTDVLDMDATGAITMDSSAGAISINSAASTLTLDGNSGVNIVGTAAEIDLTTSGAVDINSGAFTVDGSTVSLDGSGAMNFTSSGGAITVDAEGSTLTLDGNSGVNIVGNAAEIDVTTSGALDLNSGAYTLNCSTGVVTASSSYDVDATGILSLNSSAAINVGNDVVAQAINVGTGGARTITVGSAAATEVEVNADLIDLNSDAAVTIDGAAASNFTTSSGALTLDGAGGVNIAGNAAEIDVTTSGALDLNSGAYTLNCSTGVVTSSSTYDVDATGALSLNSSAVINIGDDTDAFAINVGTGAAARPITIGNATTTTAVNLTSGASGDITFTSRGNGNPLTYNDTTNGDITGGTYIGSDTSIVTALLSLDSAIGGAGDVLIACVAGEILLEGDLVFIDYTDANKVFKADADAANERAPIGFAQAGVALGAAVNVAVAGKTAVQITAADAPYVDADIGAFVYMDDVTPGAVTMTPPGTAGDTLLRVGTIFLQGATAVGEIVINLGTPYTL